METKERARGRPRKPDRPHKLLLTIPSSLLKRIQERAGIDQVQEHIRHMLANEFN